MKEYLRWDGIMEQISTHVQESVSTLNQAKRTANDSFFMPTSPNNVGIVSRLLKRPFDLEKQTNREYVRVF